MTQRNYIYCLGIAVVTPLCIDKLLESWASERLTKGVITVCFASALASLVLLAIVRGDILLHQIQDVSPVVIFEGDNQAPAAEEDNFYATAIPLLRLVMALLAVAMELRAGLAFHDAQSRSEDSHVDYEPMRQELHQVRAQMVVRLQDMASLRNEASVFAARFWRDSYRAMLVHILRSALTRLVLLALCVFPFVGETALAQERLRLVVAIDLSQSVNRKTADGRTSFQKNLDAVNQLLAHIPAGTHITIVGITDSSFAQPSAVISLESRTATHCRVGRIVVANKKNVRLPKGTQFVLGPRE